MIVRLRDGNRIWRVSPDINISCNMHWWFSFHFHFITYMTFTSIVSGTHGHLLQFISVSFRLDMHLPCSFHTCIILTFYTCLPCFIHKDCYDCFILFLLFLNMWTFILLLTLGLDVALCLSSFVSLLHKLPQHSLMFYFLSHTLLQRSLMHSHKTLRYINHSSLY